MYRYVPITVAAVTFLSLSFLASVLLFSPQRAVAEELAPAEMAGRNIRPLEVHIANNGLVLLRSARVLASGTDSMTVSTAWGASVLRWTLQTHGRDYATRHFGTRFLDSKGADIPVGRIHVGDLVTVTGMLDATASEAVIITDSIRDLEL